VIVLISNHVIIYDGDDPDLPMWMKIKRNSGAATYWYGFGSGFPTATSIYAMNGIIAATHTDPNNSSGGVALIRFIHDNFYRYGINNGNGGTSTINISQRESTTSFPDTPTGTLIDWKANDVAMTVLPNAPIDDATGLPIPTIAVATDGGVSVIKDDGTVIDLYRSGGNAEFSHNVAFDDNNSLFFSWGTVNGQERHLAYYETIPSVDDTELTDNYYPSANLGSVAFGFNGQGIVANNGRDFAGSDDKEYLVRLYHTKESATNNTSSVSYITSSYNTGWMHGAIKGAFLSDTDATNIIDANLITNGTFDTDLSGWSDPGSIASVSSGQVTLTSASGNPRIYQAFTVVPGKSYYFSLGTASGNASFYVSTNNVSSGSLTNVNGSVFTVPSGTTTVNVVLYVIGTGNTATYDNVVVKLADPDRSVNNQATNNNGKGLGVFGTVTKSAVATGAELVAYSGFSASNYLQQPYNSALSFGTGNFSIMFWVYDTGVDEHSTIISRDEREFDISRIGSAYGYKLRIYTRNSSEDLRAPDSASALPFNRWVCVCVTYTGGNTKNVYIDGKLDNTITGTLGEYDIDSTTYALNIGVRNTGGTKAFSASGLQLALLRISGSAPSAEQIKKIYEDEKFLFQENAACTLYGSSDAVTALAYDEVTERLHVGTSSGRSEFQGLRRINNTTTAVTTAISAYDSFVVEQ
jgi:hypothetical protein